MAPVPPPTSTTVRTASQPPLSSTSKSGTPWPAGRSEQFVRRQIALFEERAYCLWKMTLKGGGPVIGFCGLQPLPETAEIEIGWWLARIYWGRGLATEAARVALHDGFERAGIDRIVAIAQPANTASIRIMQKLGMAFERTTESRGIPVVLYSVARPAGIKTPGNQKAEA